MVRPSLGFDVAFPGWLCRCGLFSYRDRLFVVFWGQIQYYQTLFLLIYFLLNNDVRESHLQNEESKKLLTLVGYAPVHRTSTAIE